jgi:hypothetical protein
VRKSKIDSALIPEFVDQGLSALEIATRMGCTVGTLRVKCSQLKISLRRRSINIALRQAVFNQLQKRAALMGVPAVALAADLLEVIARDGLYDAVLDRDDTGLIADPTGRGVSLRKGKRHFLAVKDDAPSQFSRASANSSSEKPYRRERKTVRRQEVFKSDNWYEKAASSVAVGTIAR